jgi:hypothetical protein
MQIPEETTSTPANTSVPVPEDINQDGVINMVDVIKLAIKFGYSYR